MIKKLGHELQYYAGMSATCTSTGWTAGYWCIRTGCSYDESVSIPKLAHSYTGGDCADGIASSCSSCGATGSIPAHVPVPFSAVAPTCTNIGYDSGTQCFNCGLNLSGGTVRPKIEHSYGSYTTTQAATCSSSGTKSRTCSSCGDVDTATIPATGNHMYIGDGCTKTCVCGKIKEYHLMTQDPLTGQSYCGVCGISAW